MSDAHTDADDNETENNSNNGACLRKKFDRVGYRFYCHGEEITYRVKPWELEVRLGEVRHERR